MYTIIYLDLDIHIFNSFNRNNRITSIKRVIKTYLMKGLKVYSIIAYMNHYSRVQNKTVSKMVFGRYFCSEDSWGTDRHLGFFRWCHYHEQSRFRWGFCRGFSRFLFLCRFLLLNSLHCILELGNLFQFWLNLLLYL